MEHITKKEMINILKENISWLEKDVSDSHHDIRDYQYLEEEDYEYIAGEILYDLEKLFSKKRSIKIEKIKSKI